MLIRRISSVRNSPSLLLRFGSTQSYAVDQIKVNDYESYLALLLSSQRWRYNAFILNALNAEVAVVADKVTDANTALGRYNFWKRALTDVLDANSSPEHPLLKELEYLVAKKPQLTSNSNRRLLFNLVESRHRLCVKQNVFNSTDELIRYCDQTKGSLLKLILDVASIDCPYAQEAAELTGRCCGLLNAVRSTPYLARKNHLGLPRDVLRNHDVRDKDVVIGAENVRGPVKDLVDQAQIHLDLGLEKIRHLPGPDRVVFIQLLQCQRLIKAISKKYNYNVYDDKLQKRGSFLAWKIWRDFRKIKYL